MIDKMAVVVFYLQLFTLFFLFETSERFSRFIVEKHKNRSAVSKDLQTNNKGEYGKEVTVEEKNDKKMVIPFNRTSFVIVFFSFSKQFHCNK